MRPARHMAAGAVLFALAGCALPGPTASPIQRGVLGPFAFEYPSGWTLTPTGNPTHYSTVLGFVVAPPATATESCGPDYAPGLGACDDTLNTPEASVIVSFREFVNGACTPTAEKVIASDVAAGWTPAVVSGLKAAASRAALGTGSLDWTWDMAEAGPDYCVIAEVRARFGPSSAALGPAVDALVASLKITLPAP